MSPMCASVHRMIVHTKALAEIFDMLAAGRFTLWQMLTDWFFWVELLLVAGCGIFWAVQMNNSIVLYDPLFIIPLLQASYITFGATASGIFYQEFGTLEEGPAGGWSWPVFVGGISMIVVGIMLLAPPSSFAECCCCATAVVPEHAPRLHEQDVEIAELDLRRINERSPIQSGHKHLSDAMPPSRGTNILASCGNRTISDVI